ncbi:MAG TPA: hypothetical protein VMN78_05885 [Longimicrobiales bacterium]|nr:hypothetical protein [Longimicrobiales bacterium]
MRKLVLLAVLVLASCTARSEGEDMDDMDTGITDWSAQLAPQAGTDIRGTANVQTVVVEGFAGTTAAAVSIAGADVGARHPWHVHSGSCATGGPIMGPAAEYPVLLVRADGRASASANLAIGLDDNANYHINVHRSPSDLGTIVSCGNLID